MTAGVEDGTHDCSRSTVEDSLPSQSIWRMLTAIGLAGKEKKAAARSVGEAAERALLLVMEQKRGVKLEAKRRRWTVTWPPLSTHHREAVLRVKTPDERWVLPEDINPSLPRLRSLKVTEEETSPDAFII